MKKIKTKKFAFISICAIVAVVAVVFYVFHKPAQKQVTIPLVHKKITVPTRQQTTSTTPPAGFDKTQYPTDQASSVWVVVNKGRQLPSTYVPAGLTVPGVPLRLSASSDEMHVRSDTATAMETMFKQAATEGVNLMLASGYRSYSTQYVVHQNYASSQGAAQADTFSARAGYSEHQTGLAADLEGVSRQCEVEQCFENTVEGKWLAANSYKYGFIIRYPKNAEQTTGYQYEPWHVRYVGVLLANEINKTGQTLEQFFGLPIYTDYPTNPIKLRA